MSQQQIFRMPQKIITGVGAVEQVGEVIKELGGKRALIITDKILTKLGMLSDVEVSLRKQLIDFHIYDDIPTEPTIEYVNEGIKSYEKNCCDCILAVGGGSAIDTAKAVSIMLTNDGSISDYMGLNKIKNRGVPLVAVPTTAGTGSEVTVYTIITDTNNNIKMLIGSDYLMPIVAIADPIKTISMPKTLTAATGMDALCHSIEAYVSLKANAMSDIFSISAIELIAKNLRLAWANGNNLEAREKMMLGALKAGVALNNSSVTLVHGMSRPIGAVFHIPHGMSNAVLLSAVMEFSLIANPKRYAKIAEAMEMDTSGLSEIEAAKLSVVAVRNLVRDIQIPSMSSIGIDEKKLNDKAPEMAEAAIASGSPANNPRQVSKDEIIELYKTAYKDL
jgi:alcohol dehydrogenase class IV